MVLLVQCSSKHATPPSLPQPTSFLFESNSLSLALTHSDSSLSIFPSFSSLPSNPQTLIPPPCSSSSFLLLKQDPEDPTTERVLFLAAGPRRGSSRVLLRVYILQRSNLFAKARVFSNQKGIGFDPKLGVLLDIEHGVSLKVVGSVNFFAIYCVSSKKVWVFVAKLVAGGDGGDMVKLMRCAVVDCCAPVWSVSVSSGCLVLGEDGGVRVFNLRQLVKGKVRRVKGSSSELSAKVDGKVLKLLNGITRDDNEYNGSKEMLGCNGGLEGKIDKHVAPLFDLREIQCDFSLSTESFRGVLSSCIEIPTQDSDDGGACFFAFKSKEVRGVRSMTVKALSIQPLTTKKFLILDSLGDIYTLDLPSPVGGSSVKHMKHLTYNMRVKKLVVVPDVTSKSHTVWVSDGSHTVHKLALSASDDAISKLDGDDNQEELTQISAVKAIFTSEQVQDLVPVTADILLVLGQGHIYVYAIP